MNTLYSLALGALIGLSIGVTLKQIPQPAQSCHLAVSPLDDISLDILKDATKTIFVGSAVDFDRKSGKIYFSTTTQEEAFVLGVLAETAISCVNTPKI